MPHHAIPCHTMPYHAICVHSVRVTVAGEIYANAPGLFDCVFMFNNKVGAPVRRMHMHVHMHMHMYLGVTCICFVAI